MITKCVNSSDKYSFYEVDMMQCFNWFWQAVVFLGILSLTVSASSNVFESIRQVPRGWTRIRSAEPEEGVKLRLSLKQRNLDEFYATLMKVSTPGDPQYGKHYKGHELRSLLRPSEETTSTATAWLQDNNITSIRNDGEYLLFRTTVATANKLLDTQFDWYRNAKGEKLLRTMRYSVPEQVMSHINFVQPTTRFGSAKPMSSHVDIMSPGRLSGGQSKWVSNPDMLKLASVSAAVDATCNSTVTPQCLFQLYNINFKGSPAGNNRVGYASFVGESARFSDMATFEQVYAPFATGRNVSCDSCRHCLPAWGLRRAHQSPAEYIGKRSKLNLFVVLGRDIQRRSQRSDKSKRL